MLNCASLHNYKHLLAFLPAAYPPPKRYISDHVTLRKGISAQLRDKKRQSQEAKEAREREITLGRAVHSAQASLPTDAGNIALPTNRIPSTPSLFSTGAASAPRSGIQTHTLEPPGIHFPATGNLSSPRDDFSHPTGPVTADLWNHHDGYPPYTLHSLYHPSTLAANGGQNNPAQDSQVYSEINSC